MPPAISSDHEESPASEEEISPTKKGRTTKAKAEPVAEEEEEEEEEEDDEAGEPDEYVVEKILGHKFVKGELTFDVKWQGYDNPKDRTWEPEANMTAAVDVMNEYFDEIGGRPEPKAGQKRKGRASGVKTDSEAGTPVASAKRTKQAKQEKEWTPPPGSWENDVEYIDTVEENTDAKTGKPTRYVYVVWRNKKKTQHPLQHVNLKCPQKMLQYYESHLVFTQNNKLNGDDDGDNVSMEDAY